MKHEIIIRLVILALCIISKLAYCDVNTWNIQASNQDLKYITRFNNSLPICIQDSISQTLKIEVYDQDYDKSFKKVCGYSYEDKSLSILSLHIKSNPGACGLDEIYAHELGHHYDWFVGISSDPRFKLAFKQDWLHIKNPSGLKNSLWLDDPEEVAAELFALEFMGSKNYYNSLNAHDMRLFPRSKVIFEKHLCVMPK